MNKSGVDLTIHSYIDKNHNKCSFSNLLFTAKDKSNSSSKKLNTSLTLKKDYSQEKNYVKLYQKPKCNEGLRLMRSYTRIQKRKQKLLNYSNENHHVSSITPEIQSINPVQGPGPSPDPMKETSKALIPIIELKKNKQKTGKSKSLSISMEGNEKMRLNFNKKISRATNNIKHQTQSALPKVINQHQRSKSTYDFKLYQLSEMKDKSSNKSRKVSQCFKNLNDSVDNADVGYDIVFNEEKEKIIFNDKPNLVKTSLVKVFKKKLSSGRPTQSLEKDTLLNNKYSPKASDFSELLKQEKENAKNHYLKKKQLMLNSYEKKKKNNSHLTKARVIDCISMTQIKKWNSSNMKVLRNEVRKKMSSNVVKANHDIRGFKSTIVCILDDNLSDVKSELNHLE